MEVLKRIQKKFKDGTFIDGKNCKMAIPYDSETKLYNVPISMRTPGFCVNALDYGNGTIADVPKESRTRDFFLHAFPNESVCEYMKNHINEFDREFFKDLIVTNRNATIFDDRNCFEIMPLEYIDEEMCSIAAIHSRDSLLDGWFESILKRKKEAITEDLYKFAVKNYSTLSTDNDGEIFNIVPSEYIDEEFYHCLLTGNILSRVKLETNEDNIMDYIPEEILTPEFLKYVIDTQSNSIGRFNKKGLNTLIKYSINGKEYEEEIWKYAIRKYGKDAAYYIPLNDEVNSFFMGIYDKDSLDYFGFKFRYKDYKRKHEDLDAYQEMRRKSVEEALLSSEIALLTSMISDKSIDEILDAESKTHKISDYTMLPIEYRGSVPNEYKKEYDSEEYLEYMYKKLGIEIESQRDFLFFNVKLPVGWTVENDHYYNYVKDENGDEVISYFYDSKFYDMAAYVVDIKESKNKTLKLESV